MRYTIYPDSSLGLSTLTVDDWANLSVDDWASLPVDPADSTQNTYNRLGEKQTFTDQRGTVHTYLRDKLGRQTDDCITTVGADTDSAVLRISTGYEVRGMVNLITSADNATPGSGTILNQVAMTFNSFVQLTKEQQDHNGAVSGSSPSVQYGYDSGGSGSNEIRFTDLTYPNGRIITNSFGTTGGINDLLNRIDTIQDTTGGTTNLAAYTYLGLATVVKINYPEPQVNLDLWGGTSGVFTGFDLFGRIINQPWYNYNTSTMLDQYQYGYDQNSNRIWKANIVSAAASVPLDEFYALDNLNRLGDMQRGTLNAGKTGIAGTPTIEQNWTLDPTGNWSNFLTKSAGTTDLDQTRTSSTVNEITNLTESTGPTWIVPAYDAAGNITTMPQTADPTQKYVAVYDAWNQMVNIGDGTNTVAGYKYDGRGRRILRLGYTSSVLSETRDFYFTSGGRDIEQRINGSTSMDQQHVWGIRYINELVCRDDATPERLYVCQDPNYNVTAVVSAAAGAVVERFIFDPYGTFIVLDASWSSTTEAYAWMYLFQGGLCDLTTRLYLFRHRDFASLPGTWLERDRNYRGGANFYEGIGGNPATYRDPYGRECEHDKPKKVQVASGDIQHQRVKGSIGEKGATVNDLINAIREQLGECDCISELDLFAHGGFEDISIRGLKKGDKIDPKLLKQLMNGEDLGKRVDEAWRDYDKNIFDEGTDDDEDVYDATDITPNNATAFGKALDDEFYFCAGAEIRLLSCEVGAGRIPQMMADSVGVKVLSISGVCRSHLDTNPYGGFPDRDVNNPSVQPGWVYNFPK